MNFIKNAYEEIKKSTVPSTKELLNTTKNVVLFMFLVAFLIFLMDFALGMQNITIFGWTWKGILGSIYSMF